MNIDNSKDQVTIVLPTLNEEESVGPVIDELKNEGYSKFLVVDGHSKDKTVEIAKERGAQIVIQEAKGKTDAIKSCLEHLNTKYTLFMDCDFTYDPKDIEKFLDVIDKYDQVIGDRNLKNKNMTGLNRLGNRIISNFFSLVVSQRFTDVLSGMYMFKTDFLKEFELKSKGFQIEIELAAKSAEIGKVTQIPINYRKRTGETSVSPLTEGWNNMRDILKFSYHLNPTIVFSIFSALIMIPGIILTAYVGITWLIGEWHAGILQIGVLLLIVGSNAVAVTFLSLIVRRIESKINRTLRELEKYKKE